MKLYFKPILLSGWEPEPDDPIPTDSNVLGPVNENTRLAPALAPAVSDNVFADSDLGAGLAPAEFVDNAFSGE